MALKRVFLSFSKIYGIAENYSVSPIYMYDQIHGMAHKVNRAENIALLIFHKKKQL